MSTRSCVGPLSVASATAIASSTASRPCAMCSAISAAARVGVAAAHRLDDQVVERVGPLDLGRRRRCGTPGTRAGCRRCGRASSASRWWRAAARIAVVEAPVGLVEQPHALDRVDVDASAAPRRTRRRRRRARRARPRSPARSRPRRRRTRAGCAARRGRRPRSPTAAAPSRRGCARSRRGPRPRACAAPRAPACATGRAPRRCAARPAGGRAGSGSRRSRRAPAAYACAAPTVSAVAHRDHSARRAATPISSQLEAEQLARAPRRCARRARARRGGSSPGVSVKRGTTPVIGTSQPWRRRDPPHHVAGEVLRVGEHVGRGEDATGGHAVLVEQSRAARRTARVAVHAPMSASSSAMFSPRAPWVAKRASVGELGSAHRLAQPGEHAVGVGGDHDLGAVAGRVHVRRRDAGQHAARARAHDAAELVVGHRRLHQRGDRLVDGDVDLLALARVAGRDQRGERADHARTPTPARRRG